MVNYFDLFNSKIERKLRILLNEKKELKVKFRRSSIQKIFVSKTTTKHFINKIVITIYTFNQQKRFILENTHKLHVFSMQKLWRIITKNIDPYDRTVRLNITIS